MKFSVLLLSLIFILAAKAYAFDNHDFQVWNTDTEEFKINEKLKAALEEEFRFGDNANDFYYHHSDVGVYYDLSQCLNIGGGYRYVLSKSKGKFMLENEPYLAATLFWDLWGFKFDDRSRLEYQQFDYQADDFRYRNKFTVKLPWKFTKFQIQPYLSNEAFLRFGGTIAYNQDRFYSGLSMVLTKNLKADIYYMLQNTKSGGNWTDINVLGTKLKLAF